MTKRFPTIASVGFGLAVTAASLAQIAGGPAMDGARGPDALLAEKPGQFKPRSLAANLPLRNIPEVVLGPLDVNALLAEDARVLATGDRTLRNGVVRPILVGEFLGQWTDDGAGGLLWIVDVGSENAVGLRVRLHKMDLPPHATVSIHSLQNESLVSGPFSGKGDLDSGEAWSVSLRGARARVEYHLPVEALEVLKGQGVDINNPGIPFEIADLVHMYIEPGANADRGETEPCHVDINCVAGWQDAKAGTARINFVKNGGSFLCTGLLLIDQAGDFPPYFMTANHCFDTQASATSAEVVWNWWKNGCNGANPDYFTRPRSRVATLLATGAPSDYTFIMIEGALAAGRWWNGWDSGNIPNNSSGAAVHHPGGGVMRYSSGTANYSLVCSGGSHFRTNYNVAPTEPGSSGSGWYDAAGRFRGQLHCGFSFCGAALDDGDDWGHFAVTYPNIAGLLAASSDDSSEPNNSCAAARSVSTGTLTNRIIKFTNPDWYSIVVPNQQRVIVTLNFEHDYGDIDASLLSACGSTLDTGTSTSDVETLEWANTTGAPVTVQINPYLYQGGSFPDTRNQHSMTVSLVGIPPANDFCSNAAVISSVPFVDNENNASAGPDAPAGSCNSSSATVMQNAMWYRWTAPANVTATFSAAHPDYDGIVTAFTGACGALSEVACGDGFNVGDTDTLTFNALAGVTYYFAAGDWGTSPGGGDTTITLTTRVSNETCATASAITTLPFSVTQDTSLAQADGPPAGCDTCGGSVMQNDVWYSWTADRNCLATFTLSADTYDAVANIWSGTCGSLSLVQCFDEPEPFDYSFAATAGTTYYFQFGDWCLSPGGGPSTMTLKCVAFNDECSGAESLDCNSYVVADLSEGTTNPADPLYSCHFSGPNRGFNSLWYAFTAQTTSARLATTPVDGGVVNDSLLAVYSGSCGSLVEIACNDDANGTLFSDLVVNGLVPGNTYYVQISAWSPSDVGAYGLAIECPPDCVTCPSGAFNELESCGADTNGGCNSIPSAYDTIACGQTICGTHQYDGSTRDTDFYQFTLDADSFVEWTVSSQVDMQAALLPLDDCFTLFANIYASPCEDAVATAFLPAGTYAAFAAPDFLSTVNGCTILSNYTATLRVSPACLGDANGDGIVSFADITRVLENWNLAGLCGGADANGDGVVTFADITRVLENWGTSCVARQPYTIAIPAASGETSNLKPIAE